MILILLTLELKSSKCHVFEKLLKLVLMREGKYYLFTVLRLLLIVK